MENVNNYVRLCGEMVSMPVYSHAGRFDRFYTFPLAVPRLSGNIDTINIITRDDLSQTDIAAGARLCVEGEIHSFNNKSGIGNRLVITVFSRSVEMSGEPDTNHVELHGTLCKDPVFRVTPMGREICDMMLAVNRRYGRSDYLPCIAWGRLAETASEWSVGKELYMTGRLQSRNYIKLQGNAEIEKTAFEISAVEIEEA